MLKNKPWARGVENDFNSFRRVEDGALSLSGPPFWVSPSLVLRRGSSSTINTSSRCSSSSGNSGIGRRGQVLWFH